MKIKIKLGLMAQTIIALEIKQTGLTEQIAIKMVPICGTARTVIGIEMEPLSGTTLKMMEI